MTEGASWRDRFPDDVTCVRCLEVKSVQELDRLLWCEDCLERARRRAALRGWLAGGVLTLVLAAYIYFGIRPDMSLIPTGWAATLAVAFYLGSRVAREILFGVDRLSNRRAAEATPPAPGSGRSGVEPEREDGEE